MGAYPTKRTREEVLESLKFNNVEQSVIDEFNGLPETIVSDGVEYKLNLVSTFFSVSPMWTNYEYNYYNNVTFKTLFKYKCFTNVGDCINYLKESIENLEKVEV